MRMSTTRRASMAIVAAFAATTILTGCDSGPTAQEDFRGDLKAMGYKLVGDITSENEKTSLGLAPMAFEAAPAKPTKNSGSDSTASSKPKERPTKPTGTSTKQPTPATTTTKAPKTVTVLEATVNVGDCMVELERLAKDTTTIKTVGDTDIQDFWVDEANGKDALGAPVDAPTVKAVKQYLKGNDYACFNG